MKTIINYLFPNDWEDVETLKIYSYSHHNGSMEGLSKIVVIQKSNSTGRYRKQTVNVNLMQYANEKRTNRKAGDL